MINKPQLSGRIARWILLLQEFNFTMDIRPGRQHANADHLSRVLNELGYDPVPDALPDANLFAVDVITKEYVDLIHYLTHQTFPHSFTEAMKKHLILKTAPYTMIGGVLYKKGRDEVLRHCIFQSEVETIL